MLKDTICYICNEEFKEEENWFDVCSICKSCEDKQETFDIKIK